MYARAGKSFNPDTKKNYIQLSARVNSAYSEKTGHIYIVIQYICGVVGGGVRWRTIPHQERNIGAIVQFVIIIAAEIAAEAAADSTVFNLCFTNVCACCVCVLCCGGPVYII